MPIITKTSFRLLQQQGYLTPSKEKNRKAHFEKLTLLATIIGSLGTFIGLYGLFKPEMPINTYTKAQIDSLLKKQIQYPNDTRNDTQSHAKSQPKPIRKTPKKRPISHFNK